MSALFRNISNIKGRDEVFYLLTIRINHPVILFISSCTSFLVLHFCYSYICLVSACWIGGSLKFCFVHFISSVQLLSHVWLFAIPWTVAHHGHFPVHHRLPEFTQTPVCRVSDAIQSSHPLLAPSLLPSIFPSIRVFSSEAVLIRWPKYWSFSISISPSNEYSGLISFRIDWLDLLAVQGTLKSSPTPQFKSINSLVLSFLHSLTLTSIHDHWKNHSLD